MEIDLNKYFVFRKIHRRKKYKLKGFTIRATCKNCGVVFEKKVLKKGYQEGRAEIDRQCVEHISQCP